MAVRRCAPGWAMIDAGVSGEAEAPLRRTIALTPGKTMAGANRAYLEKSPHGMANGNCMLGMECLIFLCDSKSAELIENKA